MVPSELVSIEGSIETRDACLYCMLWPATAGHHLHLILLGGEIP